MSQHVHRFVDLTKVDDHTWRLRCDECKQVFQMTLDDDVSSDRFRTTLLAGEMSAEILLPVRACLDDLHHAKGLEATDPILKPWLDEMPELVRNLAAEFKYGELHTFGSGDRVFVCGFREDGAIMVSRLCPQCHGAEKSVADPCAVYLDSTLLRADRPKH
jgi:hypothetical protein